MISTPACTRDITQIDSRGRARSCVCARMCVCMIKGTKGTKGRREDPSRKRAQGRWPRPGTVPSDQPRASPSCLSILPATSYHARDAPTDGSSALGNPVDSLTHPCQLNTAQRYNRTEENHPLFVSEHLRLSLFLPFSLLLLEDLANGTATVTNYIARIVHRVAYNLLIELRTYMCIKHIYYWRIRTSLFLNISFFGRNETDRMIMRLFQKVYFSFYLLIYFCDDTYVSNIIFVHNY